MHHVAVIDYGMGNLRSVSKALETVASDVTVKVTSDPKLIQSASHVVLPGVGSIRDCVDELARLDLDMIIQEVAQTKPLLGICLGMQALLSHREENNGTNALNIIPGRVRTFDNALSRTKKDFKVPHMGWNTVQQCHPHPLWKGIKNNARFYFVHSYYATAENNPNVAAHCDYGVKFAAALSHNNLFAVQFHPEKSAEAGLQLLRNFTRWVV